LPKNVVNALIFIRNRGKCTFPQRFPGKKSKVKIKVIAETPRKTLRIPIPASNHSKHDAQRNETEGSSETSGMQGDGRGDLRTTTKQTSNDKGSQGCVGNTRTSATVFGNAKG